MDANRPGDRSAARWRGPIGLVLSLGCLGVFVWNAHWRDIGRALGDIDRTEITLAAFWILFALVGRAWRWRVLLGPRQPSSLRHRLTATAIGFMGNNVFPGRLGEPLRCLVFSRIEPRVSFTAAIATVVMERVFDLIATLAALVIFLVLAPHALASYERESAFLGRIGAFGWVFAVGLTAAVAGLLALVHAPRGLRSFAGRRVPVVPPAALQRVGVAIDRFRDGLSSLRSWHATGLSLLFTAIVWAAILLNTDAALRAFHLPELGLFHALGVMVVLCFAVALPQAPGFIGVFQIASEKTLTGLYGVPTPEAQAFAIVLWTSQVLPVTLAGIAALWFEGFSVREVRTMSERAAERTTP